MGFFFETNPFADSDDVSIPMPCAANMEGTLAATLTHAQNDWQRIADHF